MQERRFRFTKPRKIDKINLGIDKGAKKDSPYPKYFPKRAAHGEKRRKERAAVSPYQSAGEMLKSSLARGFSLRVIKRGV